MALGKTVKQLLSEIDAEELTEWMAYDSIEPFGAVRDDYRVALLSALTANIHRRKNSRTFSPNDFMPFLKQKKKKQTWQEMKEAMMRISATIK